MSYITSITIDEVEKYFRDCGVEVLERMLMPVGIRYEDGTEKVMKAVSRKFINAPTLENIKSFVELNNVKKVSLYQLIEPEGIEQQGYILRLWYDSNPYCN